MLICSKLQLYMEVQIISETCITPSSSTPPHLKTYKISLLDQFLPTNYIPCILFYPNSQETNTTTKRSLLLKKSLSKTLSRFYPLAGKIKDNLSIDCNDEGICYTEAKSNISLTQYLTHLDLVSLNKFVPDVTREFELPPGSPVALIQETTFACGGFAIGVYVTHMVCDANSLFFFIKDWAATAIAATTATASLKCPFLEGESIFPQDREFPKEATMYGSIYAPFFKKGKFITKRIVFNESTIANLKAKATSSNNINNPTRIEVTTAVLSKSLMASFKNKTGTDKQLAFTHAVNFRRKGTPPLPEHSMGNFVGIVGGVFKAKKENELSESLSQLREIIRQVDDDFLNKLKSGKQEENGLLKYYDAIKEIEEVRNGKVEYVAFSSWCNFGMYDIDFGWGKAIWGAGILPLVVEDYSDLPFYMNVVCFMDTRKDKGVEAWITLDEDEFDSFEKEVHQYASIDPSPILE